MHICLNAQIIQFTVGMQQIQKKGYKCTIAGKGAKYTKARLPVKLVYYEKFETKSEALHREIEFKKLSRQEKEMLIKSNKI